MSARPESLVLTRMMLNTPALHASHLQKHAHWVALAGAALAGLESAQSEWVSEDNRRPSVNWSMRG